MSVITLTLNPALDKSSSVDEIVAADKLECTEPIYEAGGGGINVSRVLHRLSGKSKAIFQSGGPVGEQLEQILKEEGLDIEVFRTKEWSRENFIVSETATNRQYRFGMPGPNIRQEELDECMQLLKKHANKHDFLVLSGSIPPKVSDDFYAKLCLRAKESDLKVILDTKGEPLKKTLKEGVFLAKPNLKELGDLVGEENISIERAKEIGSFIVANFQAQLVVISLGDRGAMMISSNGVIFQASPKIELKSAVGAGDSMVAGLVYGLQNGLTKTETLQYGVACGTAAAITAGTELCRRADVLRILDQLKTNS